MAVDADSLHRELEDSDEQSPFIVDLSDNQAAQANSTKITRQWLGVGVVIGLLIVASLSGVTAYLADRAYRAHQGQQQGSMFLQVARQGALNLASISYLHTDADVRRILDSSTGTFRDDFEKHSPAFVDVVNQAQSSSEGSITAAGVESEDAETARVLVAITVTTTTAKKAQTETHAWRVRVSLQKDGASAKISNVEFV